MSSIAFAWLGAADSKPPRPDVYPTRWRQQGPVVLNHSLQRSDFIGVLFSSSCERFRLAVSFSV